MKQTLLRIGLPAGKKLYPKNFRELMATQDGVPQHLFHYENGSPVDHRRPSIRFVGGSGWAGIVADEDGANVVIDVMGAAVRAATSHCRAPVRASLEEYDMGLTRMHEPKRYQIAEMAIKTRTPRARGMTKEELVTERLLKSIEAACARYGFDCPTADDLGIMVEVTRSLGMPIGKGTGPKDEYVTLINANFAINANLTGIWFAGNLTARGHGRITAVRPGTVTIKPSMKVLP